MAKEKNGRRRFIQYPHETRCDARAILKAELSTGFIVGVRFSGNLLNSTSVEIRHLDSGSVIRTTAPKDNGGDGSQFSPTDLCAASLAACASTVMGMAAQKSGFSITVTFSLEKEMQLNPRKIEKIKVDYQISGASTQAQKDICEHAGRNCPVRLTLGDNVEIQESYFFVGQESVAT